MPSKTSQITFSSVLDVCWLGGTKDIYLDCDRSREDLKREMSAKNGTMGMQMSQAIFSYIMK